jgi:hypothetical protein
MLQKLIIYGNIYCHKIHRGSIFQMMYYIMGNRFQYASFG